MENNSIQYDKHGRLIKSALVIQNQTHFDQVYEFAKTNGIIREFINGIHYLATYSETYESPIICNLYHDHSTGIHSFVANISKQVVERERCEDSYAYVERHVMTIGMVFNEKTKSWSFHS